MKSNVVARARLLSALFIIAAALLVVRLYFVQIVHGTEYQKSAQGQYVATGPDTEDRGNIFFTTKDGQLVSAGVIKSGWRIAIAPKDIADQESVYETLNKMTPVDRDRFFASTAKTADPYEEVAFRVSDTAAKALRAKNIPGLIFVQDQWRDYPAGVLASQAIGFVGYEGTSTSRVGVYGLEREYQDTLAKPTSGLYVNPFAELFTNMESALSGDPSAHQGSIVTSIEPNVQAQLEKTLEQVMKTYTPDFAGGIVMDPHTGQVVAIGARPAFDPNTYNEVNDPSVFSQQLVEGRYELGSIMKPLTMAAGIDSGAVTATTTYNDTGCIEVGTYKICNFDLKARGVIPMQQVLSQSLNLGASFVATKTGYPVFTEYMRAYGLGERTGIDLPNEVAGDLSPLGEGFGPAVNYHTASFGQGISVSPIEMIRALSALANGGVLPNPHVVTGIKYESGITRSIPVSSGAKVITPQTAETVTDMLVKVVDKSLLEGALKQEHYSIAAKTGTAQIPKTGGYLGGDVYLHSFFGYFPAHDPRFIIFLYAYKPHGQKFASATLAHPFLDIAKFLINYYAIAPDR